MAYTTPTTLWPPNDSGCSVTDRIIGYVRVSTNKQETGPEVQIAELSAEAERRGWNMTIVREDAVSAATVSKRPLMLNALEELRRGHYDGLAVSKLDRLSRSTEDGSRILADSQRQGWRVICLDLGVDTASVMGAAMFNMALNFAEVERKMIGQRTKAAMARIKLTKHVGRPRVYDEETVRLAVQLRAEGLTLAKVAEELQVRGVPTATGADWSISRVQAVLGTSTARGEYLGI